jgi:hypothetical protein
MASLQIDITSKPLERLEADLAAVGVFSDERPLRGGVGRVDWRLCGYLSELIAAGHFNGRAGEALLVPSFGLLRVSRVLALGLGERAGYSAQRAGDATRSALLRSLALGVRRLALAPLGVAADDFPRYAAATLEAAHDSVQRSGRSLELWIPLPEEETAAAMSALDDARKGLKVGGVEVAGKAPRSPDSGATRGVTPPSPSAG